MERTVTVHYARASRLTVTLEDRLRPWDFSVLGIGTANEVLDWLVDQDELAYHNWTVTAFIRWAPSRNCYTHEVAPATKFPLAVAIASAVTGRNVRNNDDDDPHQWMPNGYLENHTLASVYDWLDDEEES